MRHGIAAAALMILLGMAGPAEAHLGPSFDCAKAKSPFPELICSSTALSRLDLKFAEAYFALRQQVGKAGESALLKQAISFHKHAKKVCGIPSSGPLPADTSQMAACVTREYRAQRKLWIGRLSGAALQEATTPLREHVALQRDLQSLGYLPAAAKIDGVYGSQTRKAIKAWQTAHGRTVSGLMASIDAQMIEKEASSKSVESAANERPIIQRDRAAQNALIKVTEGSQAALDLIKKRSKSSPAYMTGLAEYYSYLAHKAYSSAGMLLPFRHEILNFEGEYPLEVKGWHTKIPDYRPSSNDKIARKFSSNEFRLLLKSVHHNDPYGESELASYYWDSAMRILNLEFDEKESFGASEKIDMNNKYNQFLLKVITSMCRNSYHWALKAWKAGWPGSGATLSLFAHSVPSFDIERFSYPYIGFQKFVIRAGCMNVEVPGYASSRAIREAAARRGSADMAGLLLESAARNGNLRQQKIYANELKEQAHHGSENAIRWYWLAGKRGWLPQ